ncbi:MAG: acylneuraminate cytidylyltransferase [Elusimicrobia bacterium GWA2_69_24]|nr:MAG: acylneuraminate cytidylyltransferase [Candidatus Rokubacteria bacterium RBG_16_73_20]OGR60930.1 MAG: acylneuraminate cytidylyltransferase [Elusimicrobia bacterium GWA2_69_24]
MNPYVVGAIFARGGSKGIPRKNLRPLAGRPLLAHAIAAARSARHVQRVIVSTDDPEIAEVARRYGAEIPFMRPAELAADDSPEWLAWQHAIRALEAADGRTLDVLVSVPTTSPLRVAGDVDACVEALLDSDADVVITVTPADRSPYFNMVVLEGGYARPVVRPAGPVHRRQDAPAIFDMTTVAYAARGGFVMRACELFEGKVRAVVVPRERALDIDTELDLEVAEFLVQRSRARRP